MQSARGAFLGALRGPYEFARYLRHRLKPYVSYAADFEDVAAILLLGEIRRFIDVGANDGTSVSNTALLALRGAKGLCFEPNPADFRRLRAFYRFAGRVECIPEGLSDRTGMVELRSDGLLSAIKETEDLGLTHLLTPYYSANTQMIAIRVEPLSTWLTRRPEFQSCDVLSIDVEGHELSVLRGIDWMRHPKPARCLIIETHSQGGSWEHRDYAEICELLELQGYCKVAASANNTFWMHRDEMSESRADHAKSRLRGYRWFDAA